MTGYNFAALKERTVSVMRFPDELQNVIDGQVSSGRAVSALAFVEEAVLRLVEDIAGEEQEISDAVAAGSADIEAGRFIEVSTPEQGRRWREDTIARFHASLSAR